MANEEFTLCPKFQKSFDILGKKWNGLIIEVLLNNGQQRFGELTKKIPEISDRVLVSRLKELEEEHIVEKVWIDDNQYCEYRLTEQGQDFHDIIIAIHHWADKWR